MASIRQVAQEAGVSIATVSRVMNGAESVDPKLRRNVLDAVAQCGYSPSVGRKAQNVIALIYAGPFTVGSPYDSACLEGMVSAMRESTLDLTIVDLKRDRGASETLRQFFNRKGLAGAIIRSTIDERELVVELAREGLPLVILGDHFEHPDLEFAYCDSAPASREAVEHLVSLGHKRIAFVACHREDGDHADRLLAYREVLSEAGLLDEELIYRTPPSRSDGGPILRKLVGLADRPTALFVADPLIAAGMINEAHAMEIEIPDDLSIVGFDDTDLRNLLYPRMSSVCQDSEALGRNAFQMVRRKIEGGRSTASSRSGGEAGREAAWLEIHASTAQPPSVVQRILPSGNRM